MTSQRTRNRLVERLIEKGVQDGSVLDAIRVVPRHLFIDEAMASRAYEDTALPIGYGQTISQPWVVAKMTQWLMSGQQSINNVLEIGTGSGYQTAILSLLIDKVYSVERIQPLSERAISTMAKLELDNIEFSLSDGHWGWAEKAPFDAIISAASPAELPMELINQLKMGGRLVMPIGESHQLLYGFEKTPTGVVKTCLGEVMFVPMKQGVEV
ncbi:protein-L-isoaspartate(D-aspartate) O-methyltransferase [Thiomicrorhabdus sp. Kp2]|uniref:protein-L-isoaspartate(D-aspartate) O-methyltransferase n=1 Tax=Thiomicrorhabdus sp. Kp2 TaxID=1123518 RepID=UPI000418C81B|nr:protein-L-isoaspartate(D-aspartate) O-methyltransferase [Thiomicrorhabdus sp. Kp2]